MQLLSFRKPYEMLPPVPEAQMLTHGFAYQHGTFLRDIGLDDIDPSWSKTARLYGLACVNQAQAS